MNQTSKKFLTVVVPWILFFLIDLAKKPKIEFSSEFFLWYHLPGFFIWMAITLPVFRVLLWSEPMVPWKRISFLVFFGVTLGAVKVTLNRSLFAILVAFFGDAPISFHPQQLVGALSFYHTEAVIISWVLIIILYVLEISRKYRDKSLEAAQLSSALAEANLQALKMQIQPHFLFNAHNAIATLLRSDQSEPALEMLLKLSNLLRVSLNNFDNQFISLKDEVEFAQQFLEIEEVRFEEHLTVTICTDEQAREIQVPVFILQPLVENGIKHGVSKNIGPSMISISSFIKEQALLLEVYNSGDLQSEFPGNLGIGLKNVRERIFNHFGNRASLSLSTVEKGVMARLSLPYDPINKKLIYARTHY